MVGTRVIVPILDDVGDGSAVVDQPFLAAGGHTGPFSEIGGGIRPVAPFQHIAIPTAARLVQVCVSTNVMVVLTYRISFVHS